VVYDFNVARKFHKMRNFSSPNNGSNSQHIKHQAKANLIKSVVTGEPPTKLRRRSNCKLDNTKATQPRIWDFSKKKILDVTARRLRSSMSLDLTASFAASSDCKALMANTTDLVANTDKPPPVPISTSYFRTLLYAIRIFRHVH